MKTITTLLLIFTFQSLFSQEIEYTYDNAGNRTARCESGTKSASNATEENDPKGNPSVKDLIALVEQTNATESANKEKESSLIMSVYPNPTTNRITISTIMTHDINNTEATYTLLDSKGNIIDRITSAEPLVTFQVSHLAKGIYYVYCFGFIQQPNSSSDPLTNGVIKKAWRVVKE